MQVDATDAGLDHGHPNLTRSGDSCGHLPHGKAAGSVAKPGLVVKQPLCDQGVGRSLQQLGVVGELGSGNPQHPALHCPARATRSRSRILISSRGESTPARRGFSSGHVGGDDVLLEAEFVGAEHGAKPAVGADDLIGRGRGQRRLAPVPNALPYLRVPAHPPAERHITSESSPRWLATAAMQPCGQMAC